MLRPDIYSKLLKMMPLLVLFLILNCGCGQVSQELFERSQVGYYYGRGITKLKEQKFHAAVANLSDGLKECTNSGLLTLRGYSYCKLGKFSEALDDFSLALKYRKTEDYNIGSINRHLSEIPYYKDAFLYANRGLTYSKLEENDKALADTKKAIELDPESPEWYCYRALVLANIQDYDSAFRNLAEAIKLDRKNFLPYHVRAGIYLTLEKEQSAEDDDGVAKALGYTIDSDITAYSVK